MKNKSKLLFILIIILLSGCKPDMNKINKQISELENTAELEVYFSRSPKAHAYHWYEDCEYLHKTVYYIDTTDQETAKTIYNRHVCRFCKERKIEELK